jgi:hypothetical protein
MREDAVEHNDHAGQLLHFRPLRIVKILGRGDEQAEQDRRQGRGQPHHHLDDVARILLQVTVRQPGTDRMAEKRAAEHQSQRQQ